MHHARFRPPPLWRAKRSNPGAWLWSPNPPRWASLDCHVAYCRLTMTKVKTPSLRAQRSNPDSVAMGTAAKPAEVADSGLPRRLWPPRNDGGGSSLRVQRSNSSSLAMGAQPNQPGGPAWIATSPTAASLRRWVSSLRAKRSNPASLAMGTASKPAAVADSGLPRRLSPPRNAGWFVIASETKQSRDLPIGTASQPTPVAGHRTLSPSGYNFS